MSECVRVCEFVHTTYIMLPGQHGQHVKYCIYQVTSYDLIVCVRVCVSVFIDVSCNQSANMTLSSPFRKSQSSLQGDTHTHTRTQSHHLVCYTEPLLLLSLKQGATIKYSVSVEQNIVRDNLDFYCISSHVRFQKQKQKL